MIQNLINHIVFVVDRSGSMSNVRNEVVTVFDNQVKYLARRSKELNQETRVSVYLFDNTVECLIYDMDVMRLPSLSGHYHLGGSTALLDGVGKSIEDLSLTPTIYGDHAFLIYSLTDGEENASRKFNSVSISKKISSLQDNWTLAVLVPNQQGVFEAKKFGFPPENIAVWETSAKGINEVDGVLSRSAENFMQSRATGVRGTKNLFQVNVNLSTRQVASALDELKGDQYMLINVHKDAVIKPLVESWTTKPYVPGSSYYQLVKKEKIQGYKEICIQNRRNGKVYTGSNARKMLGLGNVEVTATPGSYGDFDVFVQSTSVNRKLPAGTKLVVLT